MSLIKIKKGLDVPIAGAPQQSISEGTPPKKVALVEYDYVGMKPTMAVKVGDHVKLGQLLFTDKKMEGVKFTAPASGTVTALNRGAKRVFESIVIECDEKEEEITFDSFTGNQLEALDPEKIKTNLIESGLWTALRARPFGKVANPAGTPHSIFVTAMDTNPLAPSVEKILQGQENHFKNGLKVISKLTEGKLFLCKTPGASIPTKDLQSLSVVEFAGPHPAGNAGTHIHFLDPVHRENTVWHIDAQEVAAVGKFFTTGKIPVERIIALAGPSVKNPRLIKTRIGACLQSITSGELTDGDIRVISGSVLSGRTAAGPLAFLGRYHQQVCALEEVQKRVFFGWLSPGLNRFSSKRILLSSLFPKKKFNINTDINGGKRSVFPIGTYEKVMPMDFEITYLLRALMAEDLEEAENLGCLELCEEDLALCSFVSPAKIEYGPVLRQNLTTIEKEG
ncbi:MAG: Na(+)-translocating NADH-quinone reductase subunit A [Candidatus Aminicenantes bacterium]|nr:Na(+)-translocating NADH-quinone reductase subunit A [Candidatus Aminicenantes bacterium]NIM82969.1 Na(+)-translocating NADH-quinone reductase subunit A [Candidatus Aminicenantes bacterium]NIN22354.1 Na(+)-translocating NADH-quinone reductase subunit A [Candidatus Aminicenantes bacterium]NIN46114.1 Na(+)-translocating NADH-quinone reductase subunit A [Candidatus Aminicenantes bacterium]NIN88950.1 Na(+)-translocating NADH-quinone reductase subunit A [Candidatus Aminicenantes bacterium]